MSIRDDGLGFDPGDAVMPGHYGLGMMRERAEEVGALIKFDSQLGHGSTISVRWPQEANDKDIIS
jgi:two-component system nitrate/nitrite sensor histidine kinase NarX